MTLPKNIVIHEVWPREGMHLPVSVNGPQL